MDDLFASHDALAVGQLVKKGKIGARELPQGCGDRAVRLDQQPDGAVLGRLGQHVVQGDCLG